MAKKTLRIPPSLPPSDWYVINAGQHLGPFTAEDLFEEFQKGKIQIHYPVKNATLPHISWTVNDLIHAFSDPAYLLMDTLQVVKERNLNFARSTPSIPSPSFFPFRRWTRAEIGIGFLAFIGGAIIVLLKSPPERNTNKKLASKVLPVASTSPHISFEDRPPVFRPTDLQMAQETPKRLGAPNKSIPPPTATKPAVSPVDTRPEAEAEALTLNEAPVVEPSPIEPSPVEPSPVESSPADSSLTDSPRLESQQ